MQQDVERVLIHRQTIAQRVAEVAQQIERDYAAIDGAAQVTLVPILTGSIIFVADLIRHLPLLMQIRLLSVSSYPGTSTTSKPAHIRHELSDLPKSLRGQHVLVIDDILDSGQTLRLVTDTLRAREPASVRTCVLLRKERPTIKQFPVDYACFDIPDEFVVGYGLDYDDYYRNLPDIVVLRPQVTKGTPTASSDPGVSPR